MGLYELPESRETPLCEVGGHLAAKSALVVSGSKGGDEAVEFEEATERGHCRLLGRRPDERVDKIWTFIQIDWKSLTSKSRSYRAFISVKIWSPHRKSVPGCSRTRLKNPTLANL